MTTSQSDGSIEFTPVGEATTLGEIDGNIALLASLFPDAVADGKVDLDVLRDLLGDDAEPAGSEPSGLRWVGMSEARRLSTLPATGTLLPRPDESVDWDSTKNIIIEGDNLEVLRLLRRGYTSKVDVIYIDPPYNTGHDFVYDDRRMSTVQEHEAVAGHRDEMGTTQTGDGSDRAQDRRLASARHAKWLSMMYPRLLVAHALLKETGVFIAAIDDNEHARLKLLLDRVFGAENFISNVVWQGGRKNDSRYISNGADYMLIYAKNEGHLSALETRWRERKSGIDESLETAAEIWEQSGGDTAHANAAWKSWLKKAKDSGVITDSVARYDQLQADTGRPMNTYGNITWPGGGGPDYDVLHPETQLPVKKPNRGWLFQEPEMRRRIADGLIWFGKDEGTIPRGISYLDEMDQQVATSVFEQDRKAASTAMRKLFDEGIPFDTPKDHRVLSRWLSLVSAGNPDALVLDFFAGSGSTAHAVMSLNASDGGRRRHILVQLDEPVESDQFDTIADITRERHRRAGKALTSESTSHSETLDIGFRSYRLADSNLRPWDGTSEIDLLGAVDNLVDGRSTDDLLVEVMLRLGIELTTPVEEREVAGATLYCLGRGTLYAYFGEDVTTARSIEVARALVEWREENPVDSDVTIVVRDTGFTNSSAKLNLEAAIKQAGFTTFRSI
ncbi:site-specific DNA-methyltransferase [Flavimobilis sp. GY10621]|uniref:Site-specific DNA-methyltransferase n=1 Tax=Flavimobilis rhizosphaerae TaxID=2775421 RepID=A0ABR9DMU3_9MICO|nr:site-specific DNA-methyltransferase [Flavimobilis rhizosphaerae]MBD9698451.1 site-specific DNA-methyltransferase [Flavimobilis rhizosphaerae]